MSWLVQGFREVILLSMWVSSVFPSYGDSVESSKGKRVRWRTVRQCTKIVRNWCDLSNETWDQEQGYYARVHAVGRRASSKWVVTIRRFDPKSDSKWHSVVS